MARSPRQVPTPTDAAPLQTQHVFLDTQTYRQAGHNPESPPMVALRDHLGAGRLHLHTTDITLAEVRKQLVEYVAETTTEIRRAVRSLGRWQARHPELTSAIPEFDADSVAAAAFESFRDKLIETVGTTVHNASAVSAVEIFQDYFARRAPFAAPASKEFPDAFVVRVLKLWCEAHDERMYVIGGDAAMADAAADTGLLLPMRSLADLLAAVAVMDTPDVVGRAERILRQPRVQADLKAMIAGKVPLLIPVYIGDQLAEGEVTDHSIGGDIEIGEFDVLAASVDEIRLVVRVAIPLVIVVDFEDRSSGIWDNEDGIHVGAETASTEVLSTPSVRVYVKLRRRQPRVAEVELLTEEFEFRDDLDSDY